jgi:hypothetical protein
METDLVNDFAAAFYQIQPIWALNLIFFNMKTPYVKMEGALPLKYAINKV